MNITTIRSDDIYSKMIYATNEEKDYIYRYELMKPFEFKWQCIGVPLKAETEGGYDIVLASNMGGGYHPSQITSERLSEIEMLRNDFFWNACERSIRKTLQGFENHGITLPTKDYVFTVLLNDPQNPMSKMTGDYCGDGGIPGYIIGTIIPNEMSLKMLPIALAHETNHNVRWQFMQWSSSITLADMIVSEGIAESYAAMMFGEDKIGMWVKNTSEKTLQNIIKPRIKEHLYENDFNAISSYLYGDEIMALKGSVPIGVPYCAGYACGYAMIQYYLKKTGKSIYETTIMPTAEIMKELEDFWN